MLINGLKNYLGILFLAIPLLLTSCIDEKVGNETKEGFITFTGINSRSYEGSYPGDEQDSHVESLRILAFNKTSRACESNTLYHSAALTNDELRYPINQGEYDFVFLANEPLNNSIKAELDNIAEYDDILSISFPTEYFTSDQSIPMIAENNGVNILADGNFEINNVTNSELTINLRRLAARVDIILKSKIDWGDINSSEFKGITFSNLPNRVPLIHGLPSDHLQGSWAYADPTLTYDGTVVAREVDRQFTVTNNSDYFNINSNLLTTEDRANGLIWAVKVKKVILPSSFFAVKSEATNAIVFTVNLTNKYSPSCKLEILSDPDYRLPANARLQLTGTIKEPLEVNIKPSLWTSDGSNWEIPGIRMLNVSHTDVKMTDMNGVRVSFWSNMPVVKVLGTVKKEGEAIERLTNEVFNCLATDANNLNPYRFEYDPVTGNGYMDLLVDGTNKIVGAPHDRTENMSGTYTLILSAEDQNGNNSLQRTITVTVDQKGLRFVHNPTANSHGLFNGVFYKHDQKGERIITGQHAVDLPWSVEVPEEYRDWLIVSATPSFDPGVGTESPGVAENYPVTLNPYKAENGYEIKGLKGRIYFRIGVKEDANYVSHKDASPVFGYINLKYRPTGSSWESTMRIYVRQGEAAEYIYKRSHAIPDVVYNGWNGTTDITSEVREDMRLLSSNSRRGSVKISPYNLTTNTLAGNGNPDYENIDAGGARFVDFPSQAGAFFQWGVDLQGTDPTINYSDYYRRAFNPSKSSSITGFPWNYSEFPIMWNGSSNPSIPAYGTAFEVCPPGYRRPSDGSSSNIVYNGYYNYLPAENTSPADCQNYKDEVEYSELRVSLLNVPFAGNASSSADYKTVFDNVVSANAGPGTYPYGTGGIARKQLKGTTFTFYSDGFFDRRPINEASSGNYGVSLNNSQVAYQGVLYFNPDTYASVFFPSTGRLNNVTGNLEGAGSTGYYWTTSAGPEYTRAELINQTYNRTVRYGAWSFESAFNSLNFRISYQGFAQAIRCVKTNAAD